MQVRTRRFRPERFRPITSSSHSKFVPWRFRPMYIKCIYINVFVDIDIEDLFSVECIQ